MIIKERWYKTAILSAVLSCFLYSLSIYFPLLGGFISFFSPLPLGYVRIKYSRLEAYISLIIVCFLLYFISGKLGVVLFLLQYGLPFFMFIEIFTLKREPYTAMIISNLFLIFLFYFVFLLFSGFSFTKVNLTLQEYMNKSLSFSIKGYATSLSKAELAEITAKLKSTIHYLIKIIPAMMFMFYSAINIGNFYILKRFIPKLNRIELTKFQIPFIGVWIFIISGFLVIFLKNFVALNIFLMISFLYLIQGLCIVEYWFKNYNISPIMRGIFLFTLFIFQFLFISIAILGLFDTWFDYRKLKYKKEDKYESNS